MSHAGAAGRGVGSPARIDRQADAGGRSARRIRGIPRGGTRTVADERRADRSRSRLHPRARTPERGRVRICVVGAGAVGGVTGAWFAGAGHDVSLVARGAHLEAIQRRGLTLISGGKAEVHPVQASSEPADFGIQDAVFICLKAYSIAAMLPRLATLVGAETVVIPAINGLPWWYFYKEGGRFDGQSVACLDPAGTLFEALAPRHILGCVVHAAAAIPLAHMNDIHGNEALLALIRKMMEEAMRVAEGHGVRIPMTVDERIDVARRLAGAKISMHQDIEKRRPLETDAIVGAVVELARKAGIATPMIDAVYALIAERAKHLDR